MTAPTLSLSGQAAISVRRVEPWSGAWFADVELDTADAVKVPTGRVVLALMAQELIGTVDPEGSGRFGSRVRVRVVGGGNGWAKPVAPRHFHNDAGVTLGAVLRATASEVGETMGAIADEVLGVDYVRTAGPASRVLGARPWYVTDEGLTVVGERSEVPAPASAQVITWDPVTGRAEVGAPVMVRPGWVLEDAARFSPLVVREVEATLGASGARNVAWCGQRDTLGGVLGAVVRELSGVVYARAYRFRVYGMSGDRVQLQIVTPATGIPDVLPASMWAGVPGVHAELTAGTEVLVAFADGSSARPVVVAFEPQSGPKWKPKKLAIDVTEAVEIGTGGKAAIVGEAAWFAQVTAAVNGLAPGSVSAPPPTAAGKLKVE